MLRFDDNASYRIIKQNTALSAQLELTTNGKGVLDGTWEVSGPSATRGDIFRPYKRVRQVLAGSRRTILESPQLPTKIVGQYKVRFIPNSGGQRNTQKIYPELSYSVSRETLKSALALISPKTGSRISISSQFKWQEVTGTTVYRLEFLASDEIGGRQKRIAALDVKTPTAKIRLNTIARLAIYNKVYWRVIAYGQEGRIISMSSIRRANGP